MKKFLVFSFYLLVLAVVASAAPVSKERAARVAENAVVRFCAELDGITPGGEPVELTDVAHAMGFNLLYIYKYRYAGVEGFVVVSGDDCTDPVLAFSDKGELNLSGKVVTEADRIGIAGPGFHSILRHYSEEIWAAREAKASASAAVARKWKRYEEAVPAGKGDFYNDNIEPLLGLMKWGQSSPYNAKCPGGSVTGCVATAFGMIMNYWDYPEHGFGYHSYNGADNPAAYPDWRFGELSADFENTYYDWAHMDDFVYIGGNDTANEAVSTLLYQIGVALEMHYTPTGSGCWSLPEYAIFDTSLHLSPDMGADTRIPRHFGYRYDYAGMRDSIGDDSVWLHMLYNSLAEGKPVYYAGWAKDTSAAGHSGTSGHGYVIDGYFSDEIDTNFFWINWGWNGTANGYFKLDAMTPQGADFTQWHGAIIGLEPDTSYHGYVGIQQPIADRQQPIVRAAGGRITVIGAEGHDIAVYDILGRRVGDKNLPAGIYIVRIEDQAYKVIMKN